MPANRNDYSFQSVIDEICAFNWKNITASELMEVAKAYYYFSIQFRENLDLACQLLPDDRQLCKLRKEECNTDNLSPWPGVAAPGEKMDHDEFVRRLLILEHNPENTYLDSLGRAYLAEIRQVDEWARAVSIASYEDRGLTRVFGAILQATAWIGRGQLAFKHFLEQHIHFDAEGDEGHGMLVCHLRPDDRILPLWVGFRDLLLAAVPALEQKAVAMSY